VQYATYRSVYFNNRSLITMRTPLILSLLGTALMSVGAINAQAADGRFYDPSNGASSTGKTIGHELFGTIGCPGRGLLDAACPKPKDGDKDGVIDQNDKCPTTPAGRKVDATGCEFDGDGDGVVDALDKCPTTPAGRKVNADGCEMDGDGDGVVDGLDKCPTTPAGRKVNADGCELDGDGDGVVDSQDKCPTVFAKTSDGCPAAVVAPAPKKLVLEGVTFDNDQATLRAASTTVLDQAAASLKEWGDVKVEVAGHTDSNSDDNHNLKLSQHRAETVRNYLIGKGIAADRLSAKGYGEANPIADNATEAGRAQNRRVELVPQK
jgi:OOP family OmpA-OmpF porin